MLFLKAGQELTTKADIYSYAVTLWEVGRWLLGHATCSCAMSCRHATKSGLQDK